MNVPSAILAYLPSFCQNHQSWWKFDEALAKTILHGFFLRHDVETYKNYIWPSKLMQNVDY